MHVLIVKNVPTEGPGTMADHFFARGIPSSAVEMSLGEAPPAPDTFTHLVVMGGPMAVYEMQLYPYLAREARLIELAIKAGKKVLGVCLGAQMIAHVLGGRVYAGPQKEIGWYDVAITHEGMQDPLMKELVVPGSATAQVLQWHGDTFDLPGGAVRLASSGLYSNQAFSYQDRVYALQFHIEVTPAIVAEWLAHEPGIDFATVRRDSERIYSAYRERATKFYDLFFR
ncbi:MAG TPA: gamma-glutamyl-gamma-aminobutyrate hydrolase family protein [Nitrospirota bacterium]|nr:gamma-glutamyl-gamma-aminobutyrate hydrolase family protein [Nitrospirota bacterium]